MTALKKYYSWSTRNGQQVPNFNINPNFKRKKMNKAELVLEVQKLLDECTKAEAERAINAVLEAIKKGVKKDKSVQLIGFGTFAAVKRAARNGVNPRTGEPLKIKASKTVKFKAGAGLKAVA